MRILMRVTICVIFCALLATQTAFAQERRMVVLDGSASMWGKIDGTAKMDLVRDGLSAALRDYGGDVGLMAYGSRRPKSCDDVAVLVPAAVGAADAVVAAAAKMKFQGQTPLTQAVKRAAAELRAAGGTPTVVLVTDGADSCRADPCALGRALEAEGADFTAHVIGLNLSEAEAFKVSCLAETTGGRYFPVRDGAGLILALRDALGQDSGDAAGAATAQTVAEPLAPGNATVVPRVLLAPDKPLAPDIGLLWEVQQIAPTPRPPETHKTMPRQLPPGRYRISAVLGLVRGSVEITLVAGQSATPDLLLNAAEITVRPQISGPGDPDTVRVDVVLPDGRSTSGVGETHFYVPAGQIGLRLHLDGSSQRNNLTLAPGDVVMHDILITTGTAAVEIFYTDGIRVRELAPKVQIYAEEGADPVAFAMGSEPVFALAPGAYRAQVTLEYVTVSSPFTVSAAQETVVAVRLQAGLLTLDAPGATQVAFHAKAIAPPEADVPQSPDLRQEVPGASAEWILPAGRYIVEAQFGTAVTRQEAIVAPGARTDARLAAAIPDGALR